MNALGWLVLGGVVGSLLMFGVWMLCAIGGRCSDMEEGQPQD